MAAVSVIDKSVVMDSFAKIPGMDYAMMKTTVTQKLYAAVMNANPSRYKGWDNPVERVSWFDAV